MWNRKCGMMLIGRGDKAGVGKLGRCKLGLGKLGLGKLGRGKLGRGYVAILKYCIIPYVG